MADDQTAAAECTVCHSTALVSDLHYGGGLRAQLSGQIKDARLWEAKCRTCAKRDTNKGGRTIWKEVIRER